MHDILGVGNAICDILVTVEDDFLARHKLEKGSMTLCSEVMVNKLVEELQGENCKISAGGSMANTVYYLSKYGLDAAFCGNVNDCFYGQTFSHELDEIGVRFYNVGSSDKYTAKSVVLVSPDGERTMCTALGCAPFINFSEEELAKICQTKYLLIEGYLWDRTETIEALAKIIAKAQENGAKIAFSLSDSFCVDRHKKDFLNLIENHVDFVFANEAEIKSLFDLKDFSFEEFRLLKEKMEGFKAEKIVVTRSEKGCVVVTSENYAQIEIDKVKPHDTTGAGDSFMAGFIYGIFKGMDIESIAEEANGLAGKVIKYLGARPHVNLPIIKNKLEESA